MANTQKRDGYQIKTAVRSFKVLEELAERKFVGATELAQSLNTSKSTMHNHLSTLEQQGYVIREEEGYRLGIQFLRLGGAARNNHGTYKRLYQASKPEVDQLADETGENVQVIVEENGFGTIIYQVRGPVAVTTDTHIGSRISLHCTSIGKSILAHLPRERVEDIIAQHGLEKKTERTISTPSALYRELDTIRDRGHAFDYGERLAGMRCVAAPILRDDGEPLGALSVSGPEKRMQGEWFESTLPNEVKQVARMIELNVSNS